MQGNVVLSEADSVIETYRSGMNWYRRYKSGWVEQGGTVTSISGGGYHNFLVPLSTIGCTIMESAKGTGTGTYFFNTISQDNTARFYLISKTSSGANTSNTVYWEARGMSV